MASLSSILLHLCHNYQYWDHNSFWKSSDHIGKKLKQAWLVSFDSFITMRNNLLCLFLLTCWMKKQFLPWWRIHRPWSDFYKSMEDNFTCPTTLNLLQHCLACGWCLGHCHACLTLHLFDNLQDMPWCIYSVEQVFQCPTPCLVTHNQKGINCDHEFGKKTFNMIRMFSLNWNQKLINPFKTVRVHSNRKWNSDNEYLVWNLKCINVWCIIPYG